MLNRIITKVLISAVFIAPLFTEARTIRIAIIDSGFNVSSKSFRECKEGSFDLTNLNFKEDKLTKHGQNITYIIDEYLKKKQVDFCIIHIRVFSEGSHRVINNIISALAKLNTLNPDIINLSLNGTTASEPEIKLIKHLLNKGIIVVAAAGNNSLNLDKECSAFPSCDDPRVIVVGNGIEKKPDPESNYGKIIDIWENGNNIKAGGITLSGTSQATAIVTSKISEILFLLQKNH